MKWDFTKISVTAGTCIINRSKVEQKKRRISMIAVLFYALTFYPPLSPLQRGSRFNFKIDFSLEKTLPLWRGLGGD